MAEKKINRTFRVREGYALEADFFKQEFKKTPFVLLDDEPLPDNSTVTADYLVYASMPVHAFFDAASKKEKYRKGGRRAQCPPFCV